MLACWPMDTDISRIQQLIHAAHTVPGVLFRGPIPEGQGVLHKCDNPKCVRPDHLFLGYQKENAVDMHSKHRSHTKLTHEQAAEIKRRLAAGSSRLALAKEYRVGYSPSAKFTPAN